MVFENMVAMVVAMGAHWGPGGGLPVFPLLRDIAPAPQILFRIAWQRGFVHGGYPGEIDG